MKILFLADSLSKGGKERRMIELIKGLSKKTDIQMALVLFRDAIEYLEIHNLNIDLHIIERKPKYNPTTFFKLHSICRQFEPDIIHAWSNMSAFFAIPSSKILKIALLNGCVANAPKHLRIWQKELFLTKFTFVFSDFIVGNSKAGLEAYDAPSYKSASIPNGFDFNRIKNIENVKTVRERYDIGNKKVIGKVAAFADRKDYVTYFKAASRICQIRDDVMFFAVGNGPNFETIKNAIPNENRDKLVFTGALSDVESLINIFDVGVLSTNNDVHREGISNSIMEYMVLGKPVIATEGGGTSEIVQDGETGFLVPPKSPKILANQILELLEKPSMAKEMGKKGKERIFSKFNLEKMTISYLELYSKLTNVSVRS